MWRLALGLALQNLGRRKARNLLLVAAVALGAGVVFAGTVLTRSIDRSTVNIRPPHGGGAPAPG